MARPIDEAPFCWQCPHVIILSLGRCSNECPTLDRGEPGCKTVPPPRPVVPWPAVKTRAESGCM